MTARLMGEALTGWNAGPVEQWLPVVGWEEAYEVSDHGRIRTLERTALRRNGVSGRVAARIRKPVWSGPKNKQYLWVELHCDGVRMRRLVHHLVLEAFVGPKADGMRGLHWDDDASNNSLHNLRWGTQAENIQDQVRNGIHPMARKTLCKRRHDLTDPENVYRRPGSNRRQCRPCRDQKAVERRAAARRGVAA